MKIIDRKTHGYLDYVYGVLLMTSPWVLDYYGKGIESWIPIVMGMGTLMYSALTDYELGFIKLIPMRVHLRVDLVAGIFLALSPWIFGFSERIIWPHMLFGIIAILVSLATSPDSRDVPLSDVSDLVKKDK